MHCPDCDANLEPVNPDAFTAEAESLGCRICGGVWQSQWNGLLVEETRGSRAPASPRKLRQVITPALLDEFKKFAAKRASKDLIEQLEKLTESGVPESWKAYDLIRDLVDVTNEPDWELRNAWDYYLADLSEIDGCQSWFTNPVKHRREGR